MHMKEARNQIRKTTDLIVGTVGLGVAGAAGAGITGTAGTVLRSGVLPMAGLGMMQRAAPSYSTRRRRRRK